MSTLRRYGDVLLLATVTLLLGAGGLSWWLAGPFRAGMLWAAAIGIALTPAVLWVAAELRRGRYGADLLAVLALAGTAAVGEYLAGAIIAVMVATGRVLESAARRRAGRDLSALLARAPKNAHVRRNGALDLVAIDEVEAGDVLVVLPGEIVPVDGVLPGGGLFDESALTGEAAPVERSAGEAVRSGVVNAGSAVDLRASASAEASTYAGLIRLAGQAAAESAPIARVADRVAVWFLPAALAIAGVAWLVTGDPTRAVAVLVTATPCPLLLAVPVAVTAGMSRMSRSGVIVKGGTALELLGRARTLAMDKTGTVTMGQPEVTDIVCAPGVTPERALADAAGVEQYSPHVLAGAVLRAAHRAGIEPATATGVSEEPGTGVSGFIDGRKITVGKPGSGRALPGWARGAARRGRLDLASVVWVEIDGSPAAALLVRDRIRPDAPRTIRRLRAIGLAHIVLLTGDKVDNAAEVAALLGLDEVRAEASPAAKIERIRGGRSGGVTVMIGDGINDAPALAAADVGIALGSRGSTAAVQAADAVIVDDQIGRLADAVEIARRSRILAVESAGIGTGLSLLAMAAAATGLLVPVIGAVVQECIDVLVILNALRALQPRLRRRRRHPDALLRRFAGEHEQLLPVRAAVRQAADALADGLDAGAEDAIRRAYTLLVERLLPHEMAEETELYPALTQALGSPEGTVTMSRGHAEIERLIRRLGRHLAESPIKPDQLDDLRATLYGLDAVLNLHFAQEEEAYFTLTPTP